MSKVITTVETISPEHASEIINRHFDSIAKGEFRQRKINKSILAKYVIEMKAGHWKLNPEPIIFDEAGNLIDGQHRLLACKNAGVPIQATVSTGWPSSIIDVVNRGKSRQVADQYHLHGMANAATVAATIACIVRVCYRGAAPPISYASSRYVLEELGMDKHINKIMDIFSKTKRSGRIIGPIAFYHTAKPRKAEVFAEQVAQLDTIKGSGSQLFAKYLRDRSPDSQDYAVQAACACLRIWDADESAEFFKSHYAACDWLAEQNKKLTTNIRSLFGNISIDSHFKL